MKKNYLFKALMAVLYFVGAANFAHAVTASDLVGRYSLVSNDSEYNGENGLAVNFDVTVREGDGDGSLILSGFFGKSNTIRATFDAENSQIVIGGGNYVEMGVSLEQNAMAAMQMLLPVVDGTPNMMGGTITLNVGQDGTISFDDHIGCVAQAFNPAVGFEMIVLEALKGGTLTPKNVQACTPDQIAGKYTFVCEKEVNEAYGENVLGGFSTGNDELTVTSLGDNQYEVSGFFGCSAAVPAVYYPATGQLVIPSMVMSVNGIELVENNEGTYSLGTMLTDLYFDVKEGKLSTKNVIVLSFEANDESSEDDGCAMLMRGGEATRTSAGDPAHAVTASDLVGRYSLVSNGSEYNGENGLAVNFDVTVREGDGDGSLILSGFFGKSNTIRATFDAENNQIVIGGGNYVEMGVSLEQNAMAAMQMLLPVVDGTPNMMGGTITLNVGQDGTISFDDHIGCVAQAFNPAVGFEMIVLEALKGGTLTPKNVQACTPDQIAGKYTFVCEKEVNEAYGENVLGGFSTGNDELTVTSLGDNQYEVSGFFGCSAAVPAVYYPATGQLVIPSMVMSVNGIELVENNEGTYSLGTMLTDLYFDVKEGKLSTKNVIVLSFEANDESSEDDGCAMLMRGGEATRISTGIGAVKKDIVAEGPVDVYSVSGVLLQKNAEADKLNLPKGTYILRSVNGAIKVAL
ncbi:MAG: hypothetical protein K2N13_06570 [Paraprevotella sp.]|nr:hypothetical protein [Paraprevotella sp.]